MNYLKLAARILSLASMGFISFFLLAHLFGSEKGAFNDTNEIYQFVFFPCGFLLGLLVAWRAELTGALITMGSVAMFHILRKELYFDPVIHALMLPAALFLLYGLLKKGQQ